MLVLKRKSASTSPSLKQTPMPKRTSPARKSRERGPISKLKPKKSFSPEERLAIIFDKIYEMECVPKDERDKKWQLKYDHLCDKAGHLITQMSRTAKQNKSGDLTHISPELYELWEKLQQMKQPPALHDLRSETSRTK